MVQDIDDKWFKAQQKRVGVTAEHIADRLGKDRSLVSRIYVGRQKMTLDQAAIFADVFQVPLATIMEKAAINTPLAAKAVAASAGIADGDVSPWVPHGGDRRGQAIAEAAGARPGVDVWQVRGDIMQLAGLLDGDFILVDTHQAERVKTGDVVIAQVYSPSGTMTVLRRLEGPYLVAATVNSTAWRPHVVDGENVLIRGKVIASWRVV